MPKIKTKDLPIKVWIDNSGVAVQYYDPHSKRYPQGHSRRNGFHRARGESEIKEGT